MGSGNLFIDFIGVEMLEEAGGLCRLRLQRRDEHLNKNGMVHGGVVSTMLDTAMGRAATSVLPEGKQAATIDLTVKFMRSPAGDMECTGRVINAGRRIVVAEAELFDLSSGKLAAKAIGTFAVFDA